MDDEQMLKPCPFCGSDRVELVRVSEWYSAYVACNACKATGPSGATEGETVQKWNERKADA